MDLEVVDALKAAGVPDDKARAVVISLHREIDQRYALHASQLATRGDLTEMKAELKRDLAEVKAELKRDVADVRLDMTRLEAKLSETKAELIRWSVGSFVAMAGVFTAISRLTTH